MEVPKNGLDSSLIKVNNIWRKRERGRVGGEVLSMIATYTQVENSLDLNLRYSQIL